MEHLPGWCQEGSGQEGHCQQMVSATWGFVDQELKLNFEGHRGSAQNFQQKSDMFICFRNIFLAVETALVGGEEGLDSWL